MIYTNKRIHFSQEQSAQLKEEIGVSFEDVSLEMEMESALPMVDLGHLHANCQPGLSPITLIIFIENDLYNVSCEADEKMFFLKDIIPSKKMNKPDG